MGKKLTIPDLSRWMHQLSQSVRDLKECYDQSGALHGWEPVEMSLIRGSMTDKYKIVRMTARVSFRKKVF